MPDPDVQLNGAIVVAVALSGASLLAGDAAERESTNAEPPEPLFTVPTTESVSAWGELAPPPIFLFDPTKPFPALPAPSISIFTETTSSLGAPSELPPHDEPETDDAPRTSAGVLALTILGAAAAIRGTIKAAYAYYVWRRHRAAYKERSSVSAPAFDLEIFKAEGEKIFMKTRAGDQIDFLHLVPNMAVRHMFATARRSCSESQPFPYVELMSTPRIWGLPTRDPCDPSSALQVINKSLRERMSSHSKEGHDDDDFGITVREMVRFAIPIVEVKPGGRDESIILLSAKNFRLFADEGTTARLIEDNPRQKDRITLLARAYALHAGFLERAGKCADDQYHYEPDGERDPKFRNTDYLWARVVVTNKIRRSDAAASREAA